MMQEMMGFWGAVASAGPYANNPPRSRQITTPTPHRGLDFKVNLTLENWNESLQY